MSEWVSKGRMTKLGEPSRGVAGWVRGCGRSPDVTWHGRAARRKEFYYHTSTTTLVLLLLLLLLLLLHCVAAYVAAQPTTQSTCVVTLRSLLLHNLAASFVLFLFFFFVVVTPYDVFVVALASSIEFRRPITTRPCMQHIHQHTNANRCQK